jgi:hypothetical protein
MGLGREEATLNSRAKINNNNKLNKIKQNKQTVS